MPDNNLSRSEGTKFQRSFRVKLLIGLLTVVLIVLMFPRGESIETEVTVGSIWIHDDLIAPFSFPVSKDPQVYQRELKEAAESVYPVFVKDDRTGGSIADSIERYSSYLLNLIDSIIVNEEANVVNPTFLSTATFNTFKNLRSQERNMLVRRGLNLNSLFNTAKSIVESAYGNGILNLS